MVTETLSFLTTCKDLSERHNYQTPCQSSSATDSICFINLFVIWGCMNIRTWSVQLLYTDGPKCGPRVVLTSREQPFLVSDHQDLGFYFVHWIQITKKQKATNIKQYLKTPKALTENNNFSLVVRHLWPVSSGARSKIQGLTFSMVTQGGTPYRRKFRFSFSRRWLDVRE